jgi:hypothetical protein
VFALSEIGLVIRENPMYHANRLGELYKMRFGIFKVYENLEFSASNTLKKLILAFYTL